MNDKIKRLRELREMKSRKAYLESLRTELTKQQNALKEKIAHLKAAMDNEQADVDRLQKPGVKSLFYGLIGKKEKKLEKEQLEAREAKRAYQAAVWELESVERKLERNTAELEGLAFCEAEYEALMTELLLEIKDDDTSEIEVLNERLAEAKEEKLKTEEAVQQIKTVRSHLQEALRWCSTVTVGNNEAARKRDKALLDARWGLNSLQKQAQQLKTELKIYPTMISGIGSEALPGQAILQMIKNTFGHLSSVEISLQEHLEQTTILCRSLEQERDDIIIGLLRES